MCGLALALLCSGTLSLSLSLSLSLLSLSLSPSLSLLLSDPLNPRSLHIPSPCPRAQAKGPKELSVDRGEVLTILKKYPNGWYRVRNKQGKRGRVPGNRMYPDEIVVDVD